MMEQSPKGIKHHAVLEPVKIEGLVETRRGSDWYQRGRCAKFKERKVDEKVV